ncbi:uncharacterized protein LOC114170687 isoform X2 [Vigna unguiculata]|uniref:uncharacterized protein LOC114170687 isoform X2 n=1 Tax=Vigna unguiculata TaxID=3917 RepID=UPI0010163E2A|nr:uncharacterized protein LOC114170687 isoform X2 [Vigna unguiculata]
MASAFPWLTVRWSNSVQMHGDCSSLLQELAVVAAGLEAAALSACCRWCCYDVAREGVVLPASCRFMVMATRWCKRLVPVAVLQVPGALPWWTAWSR